MCFSLNLSSCIIKLYFRFVDLVNFVFNFRFLSLHVWKFLSNLLLDFSSNLDPNRVIFDSVDFFLSSLSKSIKIPNFSPQFIV